MKRVTEIFTKVTERCRTLCGFGSRRRQLEISAPFDFKKGSQVNFPGYSEDDISLMREKAIASTAITEDDDSLDLKAHNQPRSRFYACGLGDRVVYHARRVSKGHLHYA